MMYINRLSKPDFRGEGQELNQISFLESQNNGGVSGDDSAWYLS